MAKIETLASPRALGPKVDGGRCAAGPGRWAENAKVSRTVRQRALTGRGLGHLEVQNLFFSVNFVLFFSRSMFSFFCLILWTNFN